MNQSRPKAALAAIFCLTVLALMAVGCKGKESEVAGKWKDPAGHPVVFNADRTFTQGDPPGQAAGKWTLDGDVVTVNVETIAGQPAARQAEVIARIQPKLGTAAQILDKMKAIKLKLGPDGKTMTPLDTSSGPGGVMTKDDPQ